ncbi:NADPH:quinone reductase [Tianweitania sediminis]|nr:NADPH:quinone reductase [Tianweitania sediminis]
MLSVATVPRSTQAAYYAAQGPANEVLELGLVPVPDPGPGEILVRMTCSGVNPSDVKARAGATRAMAWPRVVPHQDGSGVVEAVGHGSRFSPGDRVWVRFGQWQRSFGTAARRMVLPDDLAMPLPAEISDETGALLGVPALTAWLCVDSFNGPEGSTVLVQGRGAVAAYAIQFAKLRGYKVLVVTGSSRRAAEARTIGADETLLRTETNWPDRVRELTSGRGVDAVIEALFAANVRDYPRFMATRATAIVYGTDTADTTGIPARWFLQQSVTVRFVYLYRAAPARIAAAAQAVTDIAAKLKHGTITRLPLEQIVLAHELVENEEHEGRVVLSLSEANVPEETT